MSFAEVLDICIIAVKRKEELIVERSAILLKAKKDDPDDLTGLQAIEYSQLTDDIVSLSNQIGNIQESAKKLSRLLNISVS